MKTRRTLPAWAELGPEGSRSIIADPDLFYPAILAEIAEAGVPLGTPEQFPPLDPKKPSRYWIEVAYQFMKLDLQFAVGAFGFTIKVRGDGARKKSWSLKGFPNGCPKLKKLMPHHAGIADPSKVDPDEYRATHCREARLHYQRVRGFIPS